MIKGSGLHEIFVNSDLSIIGTGAILNGGHIKQARYSMQVSACSIYGELEQACKNDGSNFTPIQWLKEKSQHSQMCFYCNLILNLQIYILLYIRVMRESNYHLYVLSMKHLMKWFFGMDHYKYARWGSMHLFDLVYLHVMSPDIYKEFMAGNFSFQKTMRQFSRMAPDQLHEQNNEVIKGNGGAIHLLNRQDTSGLERWELCGPDIARLLSEVEEEIYVDKTTHIKHHEDTPAFQKRFASDVKKVYDGMVTNPFEVDKLTKVSNTNIVYSETVFKDLTLLLKKGQAQFDDFGDERLIKGHISIYVVIRNNNFCLPGKFEEKEKENEKKLNYSH